MLCKVFVTYEHNYVQLDITSMSPAPLGGGYIVGSGPCQDVICQVPSILTDSLISTQKEYSQTCPKQPTKGMMKSGCLVTLGCTIEG